MPPFINEPTVYNETDNIRIICRSNATPSPRGITWQRNDVEVSSNALLTISSIQRSGAVVSRGQTAFFRFYLWWRKKGSGLVYRRISS